MQFSTIALLLAALIAPSAAEYVCHSDASFNSDVDTMPSAAAQKYLGSALVDAFNEAYAGVDGVTMDYDDVEGFDTDPSVSAAVLLRGGANLERRSRSSRRRRSRSTGGYGCNLCKTYDDDATAALSGIDFGVALLSSKEHVAWEKLFCAKGSANAEFTSMTDCKIDLSNCHDEDDVSGIPNVNGIPYKSVIPSVVDLLAIARESTN